jgi:hypothetical protein
MGLPKAIETDRIMQAQKTDTLFGIDCFRGAYLHACATVGALIGIDNVNGIAFADRFNGTLRLAAATCNACVIDLVRHSGLLM